MAEDTGTTSTDTGAGTTDMSTTDAADTSQDGLADAGKKALAAERSARRAAEKANADMAKRLKEIEDRDKTEVQKAADRAEVAEKALLERDREALRLRVAMKHNLPSDLVDRLRGDDEDAMSADAKQLVALLKPGRTAGQLGQGASGAPVQDTPAAAFARLMQGG